MRERRRPTVVRERCHQNIQNNVYEVSAGEERSRDKSFRSPIGTFERLTAATAV